MYAITGATGQLGQATLHALLTQVAPKQVIAVARDPQKAADLRARGVHVRPGDYNDPASLTAAFQGVDTLLFIATSELAHAVRVQQHQHVIDAAKQAGVRHVVYVSGVNPTPTSKFGASPGHYATEQYLRQSGLAYTLVRDTLYLDLLPLLLGPTVVADGQFYFAAGEGRVSFVLRTDVAQALANLLTSPGPANQVYELAPAPAHTLAEVASALSEVVGRPIQYVEISEEQLASGARQQQVPEPFITLLTGMAAAMRDQEFAATSPALAQLLGHAPTTLKTYLQTVYGSQVA
ncbi:SDR family oxidoreductase [Hymenobacter nivis]|nr:SDR family oxidoreductase [Hymenobacter nivis]